MSVERGHRGSRATSPRIASSAVTLLLAVGVALGIFPLPPVAPASATVSDAEADGIAVVAAPAEAGLVRQGTMLTVRVTVRNDTAQTLPAGEVVLSVDPAVATGRARTRPAWRYCDQLTPVRSLACVGAFSHSPSMFALATPVRASWNR